jgi:hypothetical protein
MGVAVPKNQNGWESPAQLRQNEQNGKKCHQDAFLSVKTKQSSHEWKKQM